MVIRKSEVSQRSFSITWVYQMMTSCKIGGFYVSQQLCVVQWAPVLSLLSTQWIPLNKKPLVLKGKRCAFGNAHWDQVQYLICFLPAYLYKCLTFFQLFLAKLVWRISIYKILTKALWTPNFWHFKLFNIYKLISPQTIARSILLQHKKEMMKITLKNYMTSPQRSCQSTIYVD